MSPSERSKRKNRRRKNGGEKSEQSRKHQHAAQVELSLAFGSPLSSFLSFFFSFFLVSSCKHIPGGSDEVVAFNSCCEGAPFGSGSESFCLSLSFSLSLSFLFSLTHKRIHKRIHKQTNRQTNTYMAVWTNLLLPSSVREWSLLSKWW